MAISDVAALPLPFEEWLDALSAAGVDAVQIREKSLTDRRLLELVRSARERLTRTLLIVNGRPDVALAGGADGVHLPGDGLPAAAVRRRFPDLRIGVSTHRADEVAQARDDGADWVTFGPVYATPSKAPYGPPQGIAALRQATAAGLPVCAVGGVRTDRLREVAAAGAAGAAAIRLFFDVAGLSTAVGEAHRQFTREVA